MIAKHLKPLTILGACLFVAMGCSDAGIGTPVPSGFAHTEFFTPKTAKRTILTCVVFCLVFAAFSQDNKALLKSTLTSVGSSSLMANGENKTYTILQSIGQLGIVGGVTKENISVQQGFLTRHGWTINHGSVGPKPLMAPIIYPNPVSKILNIAFAERTDGSISVGVFDMSGRLVLSKGYGTSNDVTLNMEHLQEATYLLQIRSGGHIWGREIIKMNK